MPTLRNRKSKKRRQKNTRQQLSVGFFVTLAGLLIGVISTSQVYAADTSVQVQVNNQTAYVAVANVNTSTLPPSNSVVHTSLARMRLRGPVNELLQLRIFVDGAYVDTVPLTPQSGEFTYDLMLNPGIHVVTIEGVSANSSPDPTFTFTVDYTPIITPPEVTTTTPSLSGSVSPSASPSPQPLTEPSQTSIQLPSWLYEALINLDLMAPADSATGASLHPGVWRPLILVFSVIAITLAPWVLAAYRKIRYGWFGWHEHPAPASLQKHPLLWIRLLGIALFIGSLLFQ